GEYKAKDCLKITEDLLVKEKQLKIKEILCQASDFKKIILDSTSYNGLAFFKDALEEALKEGKNYIFRSAASLPKVIGNVVEKPLLLREDLITDEVVVGGLVIVGSHVEKTNRQLSCLKSSSIELEYIEFDAKTALDVERLSDESNRVRLLTEDSLRSGKTVVIYTSRELLNHSMDDEEKLKASVRLSFGVSKVVNRLRVKPKFIIGKGGITSSDIGTKGLQVKKAKVLGQVKPGIPVWETDEHSKFPKIPYIIFPGNVGQDETLLEIVSMLI
ncbi:MAG: hydroxyacid dehydrogenase, partial [Vallitaleaceae bacterium]|nr:hydroxyacid dehydrogenase [Vallitaleaceae bacterium]